VEGSNGTATIHPDITLRWNRTTHNGTYYLYKLNVQGNWVKMYQVASNVETMEYPPGGDFIAYGETHALAKKNSAGDVIYYPFKVVAESTSGLLSLEENLLIIPG
jgi:hypothetical protein